MEEPENNQPDRTAQRRVSPADQDAEFVQQRKLRVGAALGLFSCNDCHTTTGDDPLINSSGNYINHSCNGCHIVGGLRDFHVAEGHSCSPCHDDAESITEDELPYFYQENRSAINDPCKSTGGGAEDIDGDGEGLDNDGDGDYDENDSDCVGTPVEDRSWTLIKALFSEE